MDRGGFNGDERIFVIVAIFPLGTQAGRDAEENWGGRRGNEPENTTGIDGTLGKL